MFHNKKKVWTFVIILIIIVFGVFLYIKSSRMNRTTLSNGLTPAQRAEVLKKLYAPGTAVAPPTSAERKEILKKLYAK